MSEIVQYNKNWQQLSLDADTLWCFDKPIPENLLKAMIIKLHTSNSIDFGLFETYMERDLVKTILYGDYTPEGVLFSIRGSPPKGSIYIIDAERTGNAYFYDNSKMSSLNGQKYEGVSAAFKKSAKKILSDWRAKNPLPNESNLQGI